ncbi:hypothetical protein [Neodiprion abietis nucleopolyhedrovirus]|uniref:Uncharacterized protein n=1 Tax=Neodiprion abietis nucleopolyhedrovirus TaxID=204507 RepID=Q0ZNZ5_9CBAC|nr:hypothetical protein [Neodiprion abietis nucleopolyhedrovirus]ABC74959.1 unknown [Neodiprion abietis nucleopolyhedrovirus]
MLSNRITAETIHRYLCYSNNYRLIVSAVKRSSEISVSSVTRIIYAQKKLVLFAL